MVVAFAHHESRWLWVPAFAGTTACSAARLSLPAVRIVLRQYRAARNSGRNAERDFMTFVHLAGAAYRALTARKDGPSLYDVCDPLLLRPAGGDPHLAKFYRTALANPALRPLLRRAGLPE